MKTLTKSPERFSRFVAHGRRGLGVFLLGLSLAGTGLVHQVFGDAGGPAATVTVDGQVRTPGNVQIPSGETLTLTGAIQKAGGFTAYAQRKEISLSRKNPDGTRLETTFNFHQLVKAESGTKDPILNDGDRITVQRIILE